MQRGVTQGLKLTIIGKISHQYQVFMGYFQYNIGHHNPCKGIIPSGLQPKGIIAKLWLQLLLKILLLVEMSQVSHKILLSLGISQLSQCQDLLLLAMLSLEMLQVSSNILLSLGMLPNLCNNTFRL